MFIMIYYSLAQRSTAHWPFIHQWFLFFNFFTWMNVPHWASTMNSFEMYLEYGTRSKYSFAKYIYNFLYLSLQKLATLLRRTLFQNTHLFTGSLFICNVAKIKQSRWIHKSFFICNVAKVKKTLNIKLKID